MSEAAPPQPQPIRDAATVILVREDGGRPLVLMGQRGTRAAFMPSKFVFPGGAVDPEDHALGEELTLAPETERLLAVETPSGRRRALALAAIRELWEESGLALGRPDPGAPALAPRAPETLRPMLEAGIRPDGTGLRFVFRAVTPPGRPRRFDARFFLAHASSLCCDPEDFSRACGELGCLQWVDLATARSLPHAYITGVVLSEIEAILADRGADRNAPRPVPFYHDDRFVSYITPAGVTPTPRTWGPGAGTERRGAVS